MKESLPNYPIKIIRPFSGYGSSSKVHRRTSKSPHGNNLGYGGAGYSGFSGSVGYGSGVDDYSGGTSDTGYGYKSGSGSYSGSSGHGYSNRDSSSEYNSKIPNVIVNIEGPSKSSSYG